MECREEAAKSTHSRLFDVSAKKFNDFANLLSEEEIRRLNEPPIVVSSSIYKWNPSKKESIFFDAFHQRIIHQQENSITAIDCKKESATSPEDFFLKFESDGGVDSIRFSPDNSYFAYWLSSKDYVGVIEVTGTHIMEVPVPHKFLWHPSKIVDIFWLPFVGKRDVCTLIILSLQGFEVHNVYKETNTIKLVKKTSVTADCVWHEAASGYAVYGTVKGVLQPYFFTQKAQMKLRKLELTIHNGYALDQSDVELMTFHDATYCIHKNPHTGVVSFHCLSSSDLPNVILNLMVPGKMDLSRVDDLLVVSHSARQLSFIFDIKKHVILSSGIYAPFENCSLLSSDDSVFLTAFSPSSSSSSSSSANPPEDSEKGSESANLRASSVVHSSSTKNALLLCNPLFLRNSKDAEEERDLYENQVIPNFYVSDYEFLPPNFLINRNLGSICSITLSLDSLILKMVMERHSLAAAVALLVERPNCKDRIINLMKKAIEAELPLDDIGASFSVINQAYRSTVERIVTAEKISQDAQEKVTVSFASLQEEISRSSQQSILTEQDIVLSIFLPCVKKANSIPEESSLFDAGLSLRGVPLDALKHSDTHSKLFAFISNTHSYQGDQGQAGISDTPTFSGGFDLSYPPYSFDSVDHELNDTLVDVLSKNQGAQDTHSGWGQIVFEVKGNKPTPQKKSQILNFLFEYVGDMLNYQFLPHRVLQVFLFDMCIVYSQEQILRQLLQFQVIVDSLEIERRLRYLCMVLGYGWAQQLCLDMALRLKDWFVIVEIMISLKRYSEVIPTLRLYKVSFPLSEFLKFAASDVEAQKAEPYLLPHILSSIREWMKDSVHDPEHCPPPNVKDCDKWLPDVGRWSSGV